MVQKPIQSEEIPQLEAIQVEAVLTETTEAAETPTETPQEIQQLEQSIQPLGKSNQNRTRLKVVLVDAGYSLTGALDALREVSEEQAGKLLARSIESQADFKREFHQVLKGM